MKIAFLADSFLPDKSTGINGTQVQMYNLALAFKNAGLEVHYISLSNANKPTDEIINGIIIHWIPDKNNIFSWLHYMNNFTVTLDQIQPDILYQRGRSHLTYTAAKWSKKNRKKFVWGSNGEDSGEFWKLIKAVNKSQRSLWRKLLLYPYVAVQDIFIHQGIRNTDQVVNQTHHQKNRLWQNFNKTGVVIPSYFLPPSATESYKKEKIVLWLANLIPNKQPELFIKFAEQNQDLEWKFILAGGTNNKKYWQSLLHQAAKLKNLEMIGQVPFEENKKYFSQASLFMNTSINEGISNTLVQAWLNSTPVLSFNIDPNDWIKTHNLGYCAHGNEEQFLHHGKSLLENYEQIESMQKNCKKFALQTFAAKETIDNYLKIFRS
jgi:glycosyltransferase involved in cell wall biosynthesis